MDGPQRWIVNTVTVNSKTIQSRRIWTRTLDWDQDTMDWEFSHSGGKLLLSYTQIKLKLHFQ